MDSQKAKNLSAYHLTNLKPETLRHGTVLGLEVSEGKAPGSSRLRPHSSPLTSTRS